jgi:recombination protein RecA
MRVLRKYRKPPTPRKRDRFDLQIEGNHTYLVDHVVVHNSPETQPGGRALKFYASQRLDIRRIETLKEGTEAIGNRVRVKVVKNKVAAPFRQAEFDIEYGLGISSEGCILDLAIEHGIVQKSGSFFSYGDERLGQGRNNVKGYLRENPGVAREIERKIYDVLGVEPTPVPLAAVEAAPPEGAGGESMAEGAPPSGTAAAGGREERAA